jgi:phospholipase/lecithinase/hemolysin
MSIKIDAERYNTWNTQLLEQATSFANSASKASVFVVSAHRIISDILNHPEEFGLSHSSGSGGSQGSLGGNNVNNDNDSDDEAQEIWEDDIHLSSAAHRVFADRLLKVFDCR